MRRSQTAPLCFQGISALLSLPDSGTAGETGVLLCRTWGTDEHCARKLYRILASELSERGYPVLRFDYPGTVDSLDTPSGETFDDWVFAAKQAEQELRDRTGCKRVIVLGLGIGALVAQTLAHELPTIAGLISAAPVTNGRRFIREIKLRAKIIFESEGLSLSLLNQDAVQANGTVLPSGVVEGIDALKADMLPVRADLPVLAIFRDTPGEVKFRDALQSICAQFTYRPFDGYDALMADPLLSRVPEEFISDVIAWIAATAPLQSEKSLPAMAGKCALSGPSFNEFAEFTQTETKQLFSITCAPKDAGEDTPVFIIGNTGGFDHHGGRARENVLCSRNLASHGTAAVRFDGADTGDSDPKAGFSGVVLYSDVATQDFIDILNTTEQQFKGPVTLVGRCSSAYSAFHAAARDERVTQLVLINQLKYLWDPDEPVDPKNMGHRSIAQYKNRLKNKQTFVRLFKGEIRLKAVAIAFGKIFREKISQYSAAVLPGASKFGRMREEVLGIFETLRQRGTKVHILCTVDDESVDQLKAYFGADLKGLHKFPNVTVMMIPDSDHNFLPDKARQEIGTYLSTLAQSSAPKDLTDAA
ncbi:alpha/beta fold hydrolase [Roseibium denhamense]|uniref:Lysophospholipase, alpha-beta hydrolase superfamily n=1 Tax=Roseibium denhamense TaxID=76305 RepID=A0ABY1PI58_9HYPH|nr:alpha/beta fold hydrolase [Roseibium denhamense]SMP34945.1 Lysophospholipase, alpha-beta hydrolase superfamily [Roseibium denhamense]